LKTEKSPDQGWADADVILAVGQGVGSGENMAILESVAKTLNAGVGASRPVVMNAWADMNRLIGMSGSRVSPKLCIAVGVSGNAAFSIGIQDSEFVVAINTDRTAPIFRIADVGIVDDLMAVLAALERLVESRKLS
jgi:electron transfer flavoprotein alpha subunit